jgi:hypothetical protein
VRWVRWARLHLATALDRLGADRVGGGRTGTGYRDYFADGQRRRCGRPAGCWPDAVSSSARRIEAAQQALRGVRDVLAALCRALGDLGISTELLTVL